jgi:hypothetical protein
VILDFCNTKLHKKPFTSKSYVATKPMRSIKNIDAITSIYDAWKPSDLAFIKALTWSTNDLVAVFYCQPRNSLIWPDVSKDFFDAVVILNNDRKNAVHSQFSNDSKGLKDMIKWLKSNKSTNQNTLVCLEHTGMYGKVIIQYLLSKEFNLWVEMSLKIIQSIGLQRGKNDKIDAERIPIML